MEDVIENYLSELDVRLKRMPKKQRLEKVREIRHHLQTFVEQRIEAGSSEVDAVKLALVQFGTAETIAGDSIAAWSRGRRVNSRNFLCSVALTVCLLFVSFLLRLQLNPGTIGNLVLNPNHFMRMETLHDIAAILGSIAAGVMCGYLFPKRALTGTVAGVFAATAAIRIFDQIVAYHRHQSLNVVYAHPVPPQDIHLLMTLTIWNNAAIVLITAIWLAVGIWTETRRPAKVVAKTLAGLALLIVAMALPGLASLAVAYLSSFVGWIQPLLSRASVDVFVIATVLYTGSPVIASAWAVGKLREERTRFTPIPKESVAEA